MQSLKEIYQKRIDELRNNPSVIEYESLQRIMQLPDISNIKANHSKELDLTVKKDEAIEIKAEEKELRTTKEADKRNEAPFDGSVVLEIMHKLSRASNKTEINKVYQEQYNGVKDLKYIIRHQYKVGNLLLLRLNNSLKYSFYVLPEWLDNGDVLNEYLPAKSQRPSIVNAKSVKAYDE